MHRLAMDAMKNDLRNVRVENGKLTYHLQRAEMELSKIKRTTGADAKKIAEKEMTIDDLTYEKKALQV